jgi:hypothetical protein
MTISARRVPDAYDQYRRNCSTQHSNEQAVPRHPLVPLWLTNDMHDYHTKETWWQSFVRLQGLDEATRRRDAFLAGFTDSRSNWWCEQCFWRSCLIEAVDALGYPDLHMLYEHPATRQATGCAAWLTVAQEGSFALVELTAHAARARMQERALTPEARSEAA